MCGWRQTQSAVPFCTAGAIALLRTCWLRAASCRHLVSCSCAHLIQGLQAPRLWSWACRPLGGHLQDRGATCRLEMEYTLAWLEAVTVPHRKTQIQVLLHASSGIDAVTFIVISACPLRLANFNHLAPVLNEEGFPVASHNGPRTSHSLLGPVLLALHIVCWASIAVQHVVTVRGCKLRAHKTASMKCQFSESLSGLLLADLTVGYGMMQEHTCAAQE